ncbi:BspA family leucine-rich repeat surface protein [Butyrivibrio sp. WCD2001]|uniref:BspA family leucine-rich repeat surface protein n=1 Tax=Butyrivibrio sp. WCD2001 TaxID=1280681 RepID=UPI0009DBB2BE|nr:BspA family leucine-rich repeat surface protein [Butyrivibrio sp. WCD2001]
MSEIRGISMRAGIIKRIKGIAVLAGAVIMIGTSSIIGSAREYSSEDGVITHLGTVNSLTGSVSNGIFGENNENVVVKKMIFIAKADLTSYSNLPYEYAGYGVYVFYDKNIETVYVCTRANNIIFDDPRGDFANFTSLEEIDFSKGNVKFSQNVDSTNKMFKNCKSLKSVDLSRFDTSNVTDMSSMFEGCVSLKRIKLGNFKTAKVEDFSRMFYGCECLQNLSLRSFDTSHADFMTEMFSKCRSLTKLDVSSFDTSSVRSMRQMFEQCNKLTTLDLNNFDTAAATWMSQMFAGCESLQSLNLSSFDTESAETIQGMFYGCRSLTNLNISSFNLSNNSDTENMLTGCKVLETIDTPCKTIAEIELPREFYLDNNRDDKPDSDSKYSKIPISDSSYHFIFNIKKDEEKVEAPEPPKPTAKDGAANVSGIEYNTYSDGSAVATKITASGDVIIDKIEVDGFTYSVTEIAGGACKGNKKIKSLSIGTGVKKIGKKAFSGCKNLKKITINANTDLKIESGAFKKINRKAVIKVNGIKGKAKKKLIKALKKNADVKVK